MKVIAETTFDGLNRNYLVSVTESELANIMGYVGSYAMPIKIPNLIKDGTDVPISDIYKHYSKFRDQLDQREYDKARTKLKEMLNALTPIEDLINKTKI